MIRDTKRSSDIGVTTTVFCLYFVGEPGSIFGWAILTISISQHKPRMDIFDEIEHCNYFKDPDSEDGWIVRIVGRKRKDTRRFTQFYYAAFEGPAHELVGSVRTSRNYSGADDDYCKPIST